jgi:hypothetical protein
VSDDELIEQLVQAAERAIRNERPGIAYDRSRLRSIQVDLTIANNGGVIKGECYIQRTANIGRILGRDVPVPAGEAAR